MLEEVGLVLTPNVQYSVSRGRLVIVPICDEEEPARGEDGSLLTDYLLSGEYTVKEILPEDSPYVCDAPNPKTVAVVAGQTAEVSFTNRLKPGETLVQKVDTLGNPLVGAEFLLEWSVDGSQWTPVTFTDGYLKADVKTIVDQVVAKLAGDENIIRTEHISIL